MQTGYFNAAWHDVKNSPGWFGKVVVLALVSLIPVFGWMVLYGYLYGWARDIAWGIHAPLPEHIFDNADGKLYRRGFFALVIAFVLALIPGVVDSIGNAITGTSMYSSNMMYHGTGYTMPLPVAGGLIGVLFTIVVTALSVGMTFFTWVGSMRMAIYDRLSAGFQLGRVWSMMRHDSNGMLRIFGMNLLLSVIVGVICVVLILVVVIMIMLVGFIMAGGGVDFTSLGHGSASEPAWGIVITLGILAVFLIFAVSWVTLALGIFAEMLVVRALGYWTQQFNVPAWRGQDDPMPFELAGSNTHVPPIN